MNALKLPLDMLSSTKALISHFQSKNVYKRKTNNYPQGVMLSFLAWKISMLYDVVLTSRNEGEIRFRI